MRRKIKSKTQDLRNPLFVPVEVQALVVNQNPPKGVNVLRWHFSYGFLGDFMSPEPDPLSSCDSKPFPGTGVVLHWTLPRILRRGEQSTSTAELDFPLIPNRWLIVRYSGPLDKRIATAWVVQSDTRGMTGGAPYVIVDGTGTPAPTTVGQVVALGEFSEPSHPQPLFLTAVAPGNPSFASFQPYCQNVLSMFDPLTGVHEGDTLSYLVAGWYSDPSADITGRWQRDRGTFAEFLAQAGWQLAEDAAGEATQALYHGMVWGVPWSTTGTMPSRVPDRSKVQVAVGNTTVDALSALIRSQQNQLGDGQVDAAVLEALQYGILPLFDQMDPQENVAQQVTASWFESRSGGFGWLIVDRDAASPSELSQEERTNEAQWLAALNGAQAEYDRALIELSDLQAALYEMWWKQGFLAANVPEDSYPDGTTKEQFAAALDPTNQSSLVSRVYAQRQFVATLAQSIPTGTTQGELAEAIASYASVMGLPPSRELKQVARRPSSQAYDPVVLFAGLGTDADTRPEFSLTCRFSDQLVTGFTYNGTQITGDPLKTVIPMPDHLSAVPSFLAGLIEEFFFLDPTNATMVAKSALTTSDAKTIKSVATAMTGGSQAIGVCPDLDLAAWKQPWSPLILLWEIVYFPIEYGGGDTPAWTFDGSDYTFGGTLPDQAPQGHTYKGMIFMTPQASFNFRAQLEKLVEENPDIPAIKELEEFIATTDDWDFLSQGLVGLRQSLAAHDPKANRSPENKQLYPGVTLADLIGSSALYAPLPDRPSFESLRAGQFRYTRLTVVDRFGQALDVVNSQTQEQFEPVRAQPLLPAHPIDSFASQRYIELKPRLLQPARLTFEFLAAADEQKALDMWPDEGPVCAWLLHNFLDESIACYDRRGTTLGMVSIVTSAQNENLVHWQAAPGSPYATVQDLLRGPELRDLGQFLSALQQLGPPAFTSLLKTIDEAAWTIDEGQPTADAGMAMIAGYPVAMVSAHLGFSLKGAAINDPAWANTFMPAANPLSGLLFNIRLGEAGMRQDGLVGYFLNDDYARFYACAVPAQGIDPDYVTTVGNGAPLALPFDGNTTARVTMLLDPRAAVHATTGLLPVVQLTLPAAAVAKVFANMELAFSVGPLLTDTTLPEAPDVGRPAVQLPRPAVKDGAWSWAQYDGNVWSTCDATVASPTAQLSNVPPILRSGLLQLSVRASDGTKGVR